MPSEPATTKPLADRFAALARRCGASDDTAIRRTIDALIARYTEPHRAYHNLEHIVACLRELDREHPIATPYDAIEWAIWFHDAIYDSQAKDNEERSAELALRTMRELGITNPSAADVTRRILATRHRDTPVRDDERLLIDIDLSILGQSPAVFDRYDEAIRREYAWVSDEDYRRGRTAVLRSFLDRETIYHTPVFKSRLESQARENLRRAIQRLSTQPPR